MPVLRYFLFRRGSIARAAAGSQCAAAGGARERTAWRPPLILRSSELISDRKWPERVVFDTSQAHDPRPVTVAKASDPIAAPAVVIASPAVPVASPKGRALREAFAQLPLSEQMLPVDAGKPAVKTAQAQTREGTSCAAARWPPAWAWQQPTMRVAQQPHFGLFGNTW